VNSDGQLYTIEGVAASVLVLTTVYLVLSTTTVLTPGETHIYDMQLEQLGNDVLAVMDLNETWGVDDDNYPRSLLEQYIEDNDGAGFGTHFLSLANQASLGDDDLKLNASITYRTATGIEMHYFYGSHGYNRERAVKVTRWVNVNNTPGTIALPNMDLREQTVLLEVLLWRG